MDKKVNYKTKVKNKNNITHTLPKTYVHLSNIHSGFTISMLFSLLLSITSLRKVLLVVLELVAYQDQEGGSCGGETTFWLHGLVEVATSFFRICYQPQRIVYHCKQWRLGRSAPASLLCRGVDISPYSSARTSGPGQI